MTTRSTWTAAVSVSVCLGLLGCGGTDAGVTGGGGDGGPADGAPVDGASMSEAGSDGATGNDANGGGDVVTLETGAAEAGGDDAGCTGTGMTCRTCCRNEYADGYKKLVAAELACACEPSICGPLDAGAIDGGSDASDLGIGACAGTCGGTSLPATACDKCLTDATGSMADMGECYGPVSTACEKDSDCVAYVTCATGCQ